MAFRYGGRIITNGLVLYLDAANVTSYVSGSTIWNDLSGNGNNGTLTNGPAFNNGNGGSIVFDGVNDYINLPTNLTSLFSTQASITFTLKLNVATPTIGSKTGLANFSTSNSSTNYPWTNGLGYINVFRVQVGGSDNRVNDVVFSPSINRANIHTLTITTTPGTNGYKIYQNTTLVHQVTGQNSVGIYDSLYPYGPDIGRSGTGTFFDGNMYNVVMYNRALSTEEILQNYNALKSRFGL